MESGVAIYSIGAGPLANTDYCTSQTRILRDPPSLWTHCNDNGFMVLRFTNGVYPLGR